MTAIWPAGPPKVCSEIANQARTASRNGTTSLWLGSVTALVARNAAGLGVNHG